MKDVFLSVVSSIFFFQAEDGIRDTSVTGVQTCALPISADCDGDGTAHGGRRADLGESDQAVQIGRASCRERVYISVVDVSLLKDKGDLTYNDIADAAALTGTLTSLHECVDDVCGAGDLS